MIGRTIGRYRILEKVGEGGMGVVYKAEDTTLKRAVALKFLPVHALDDEEQRARLVREAQAAAALDHININTVYEIGESEGMTYMAMAFIEGESLKQRLKKGRMPVPEALGIVIQVAAGLTRAHAQGIVHRDVKPANVLVTPDGIVKIVDFGLAKLAGATGLTRTDSTIGTAAYMSPEQARSEVVDHRSDIWSVGVILYEMLTGRLPFSGEHEAVVIYSILSEDYKPLGDDRADMPKGIERIIAKALAKPVADRYATMGEMLQDLRSLYVEGMNDPTVSIPSRSYIPPAAPPPSEAKKSRIPLIAGVGGGLLVVLVALFLFMRSPNSDTMMSPDPSLVDSLAMARDSMGIVDPGFTGLGLMASDSTGLNDDPGMGTAYLGRSDSLAVATADSLSDSTAVIDSNRVPILAVLYLDNLSGSSDDRYLTAGITEELIRSFARLRGVHVLTAEHVAPYWGKVTDVRETAGRLTADFVFEGAVLRDKDRLRVNGRLLQVSDAKLMWSDRYEKTMADIAPLERDILMAVTAAMNVAITPDENAALANRRSVDPKVYEYYARARLLRAKRDKNSNDEAEKLYKRALGVDPEHGPSIVGLARTYLDRQEFNIDRDPKWTTQALELLARAKGKDSTDADYLFTRIAARRRVGDYNGALETARLATKLYAFDHQAQFERALCAWYTGKTKEASQALDSLKVLRSNYGQGFMLAARIAMNAGRTTEAEQNVLRALSASPNDAMIHFAASEFFMRRGRLDQAASEASEALRLNPELWRAKGQLGVCRLLEGKTSEASTLLKDASDKSNAPDLLFYYGIACRQDGKPKDAERAFRKSADADALNLQINSGSLESSYRRLWTRCLLGEVSDPTDPLTELNTKITTVPDPALRSYFVAAILTAANRQNEALEQLKAVVKPGGFSPAFLAADPAFADLRQNETFKQLVAVK